MKNHRINGWQWLASRTTTTIQQTNHIQPQQTTYKVIRIKKLHKKEQK
jgi:hypothetical protein